MELSFQHPSLLAGLALLALPVLAHLAGRRPLAQVPFPAVRFLLAEADRTAQVFAERWDADDERIARCPGADHAYSSAEARGWLRDRLLEALRR